MLCRFCNARMSAFLYVELFNMSNGVKAKYKMRRYALTNNRSRYRINGAGNQVAGIKRTRIYNSAALPYKTSYKCSNEHNGKKPHRSNKLPGREVEAMGTTTQLSLPIAFHMAPAVRAACTSACLSSPANDTAASKLHSTQSDDCIYKTTVKI